MSSLDKDSIRNYKEELKKLEDFYEQMIKNKDLEYEKILIQVDNELSEKENENEEIKNKNSEITNKYNILVDLLKDYEAEKEDSQKSIIELTNKLEENKKASQNIVSQLKKLQAIKPEDQSIISQLGTNLNSNNNLISDILSKDATDVNINDKKTVELSQNDSNSTCFNCQKNNLSINAALSSEAIQAKTTTEKLGFIDSINFTNKFIEILRDNDFDLERYRENSQDKTCKIKILDLENLLVYILEEKKELKNKASDIQTLLTTRDSKLKDLIEKDQKASYLIEELRKEKLSLQNKINELNEISLSKENLSIEKLDKQESYYKLESQKKDEETTVLKSTLAEFLKKINELEDLNLELKSQIEKKNDVLFELKNKSIDKNQLQVYYSELHKNADNFISEKQKILDKNILLFKDVEESIIRIKLDLKDQKGFYEKAENLKRSLNDLCNTQLETLNISDPSINIFKNFQNNYNYITEMEKLIEDFDENFSKIEDEATSNFAIKNVSFLPKSSSKSNPSSHTRNKSVLVNNQKNSIICRVENLNTTINSNNKTNLSSSDSNTLTDDNVSNLDNTSGADRNKQEENLSASNSRSNLDFEGFNGVFNIFIENIESINMDYLEIISGLIKSEKFIIGVLKQHRKIIAQQSHDFSSLRLEIDLCRKNENFLKNSIIYLQQCSIENFFDVFQKEESEEILNSLHNFSSAICDMDAPDVIKFSSNILHETNAKINSFLNEKNSIIENQNEKINYLNKEIDLLKKTEVKPEPQDKKEKAANTQLQKLQAQLKLKEEEISRLNERIEDHLKTINKLSKEQTLTKNLSSFDIFTPEKKDSIVSGPERLGLEMDKASAQETLIVGSGNASARKTSLLMSNNPGLNVAFIPGIANSSSVNLPLSVTLFISNIKFLI